MSITFPGETEAYRQSRNALLEEELALRSLTERVAKLRRALPEGGEVTVDYVFTSPRGQKTQMSELFRTNRDTLAIYSLMYGPQDSNPCPMCVSLLDGLDGQAQHLGDAIDLAVVSSATPEQLANLAETRGWSNLRLLSALGCDYQGDYYGQTSDGAQLPMMNVFKKTGPRVTHFWASEGYFSDVDGHPRHVDQIWPVWNVLDMTPDGRGDDWYPKLEY
jgi:predicted dithiol-disulfide oxidoreductase (DUF899 family)